jgi:hypothetical protein
MSQAVLRMSQVNLAGKRVLIREDLNVPVKGGRVTSDARIVAAIPTLQTALAAGACLEDESDGPSLSCPTEPPDGATARIRFARAGSVINNPHDRDPAIFNNLL